MALHSSNSGNMMQGGRLAMMTWSALAMLAVGNMFHGMDSSPLFVGAHSQKQKATAMRAGVIPSPVPQTPRWHRILEATQSPTDLLAAVTTSPPTTESPTVTVVLSTYSPTTQEPSPPPTFEPSKKPTALPTNKPITQSPTPSPSNEPSKKPTGAPTDQPSKKPTRVPSSAPSKPPSSPPTTNPTVKPTLAPSPPPSKEPSKNPTNQPSRKPTQKPSKNPTSLPTNLPSMKPTSNPSPFPTNNPTPNPSKNPTLKPTPQPSNKPTPTPTRSPSKKPSVQPSGNPTRQPTSSPTFAPSKGPTLKPSIQPTPAPSSSPTPSPTPSPSVKPSQRPTTSEPTSQSPTLSFSPTASFDDCLRDPFGVERIYASSEDDSNDWYARWNRERTISSSSEESFGVDKFDGRVSVLGNGVVDIAKGIATLQRSPTLQIYAGDQQGFGNAVEMTGYAKYLPGGAARGFSGFNLAIQMSHPNEDERCPRPSYRSQVSLAGVASFQKEYGPGIRTGKKATAISEFDGQLPLDRWIGVKLIVRDVGPGRVFLALYLDLTGGDDGMEQDWKMVHSYTDTADSWMAGDDSLPPDGCSSSLEDGDVFGGRRVFGELSNVGNSNTQMRWRDVSIRSVTTTTMRVGCTSLAPTMSPSVSPTTSPSVETLTSPPTSPPSSSASVYPSAAPSVQLTNPTNASTTLLGTLMFKLPMYQLLEDSSAIAVFEEMVEDLLQKKLSTRKDEATNTTIEFSDYRVNIVSQSLVTEEPASVNNDTEPVRRFLEEETSLIISASVTAEGTPANLADGVPFQSVIYKILLRNSDAFYDNLFESDEFKGKLPDQSLEYVNLDNQGGGNRSLALGTSIAGIVMLLSLVLAFFVMRRRQVRQNEEGDVEAPPVGRLEEVDNGELSSLDDSFLPDKFRVGATLPTSDIDNARNEAMADQWSLDDTFQKVEPRMPSSFLLPGDSEVKQSEEEINNDNDAILMPCEMTDSDESTTASSIKAALKQEIFTPNDEETAANNVMDSIDIIDDLKLVESSNDDNGIIDTIPEEEEVPSPPKPKPRGMKMFSCFADNTFDEQQTLTTQQIMGNNYRSNASPASNGSSGVPQAKGNVYQVRVRPGPLGILIDSSNDGPIVHEVKEKSPLLHLVEPGDIIMSVDGEDVRSKSGVQLAHWISTKPVLGEQTLTLLGNTWGKEPATGDDMSV